MTVHLRSRHRSPAVTFALFAALFLRMGASIAQSTALVSMMAESVLRSPPPYLTVGSQRQRGDVTSGGSFASTHDPRLHFGLGDITTIDSVEVRWPSGAKEKFAVTKVDQIVTLTEGKGTGF